MPEKVISPVIGSILRITGKRSAQKITVFQETVEEIDRTLSRDAKFFCNGRSVFDNEDPINEAKKAASNLSERLGSQYRAIPKLFRKLFTHTWLLPEESAVNEATRILRGLSNCAGSDEPKVLVHNGERMIRIRELLDIRK